MADSALARLADVALSESETHFTCTKCKSGLREVTRVPVPNIDSVPEHLRAGWPRTRLRAVCVSSECSGAHKLQCVRCFRFKTSSRGKCGLCATCSTTIPSSQGSSGGKRQTSAAPRRIATSSSGQRRIKHRPACGKAPRLISPPPAIQGTDLRGPFVDEDRPLPHDVVPKVCCSCTEPLSGVESRPLPLRSKLPATWKWSSTRLVGYCTSKKCTKPASDPGSARPVLKALCIWCCRFKTSTQGRFGLCSTCSDDLSKHYPELCARTGPKRSVAAMAGEDASPLPRAKRERPAVQQEPEQAKESTCEAPTPQVSHQPEEQDKPIVLPTPGLAPEWTTHHPSSIMSLSPALPLSLGLNPVLALPAGSWYQLAQVQGSHFLPPMHMVMSSLGRKQLPSPPKGKGREQAAVRVPLTAGPFDLPYGPCDQAKEEFEDYRCYCCDKQLQEVIEVPTPKMAHPKHWSWPARRLQGACTSERCTASTSDGTGKAIRVRCIWCRSFKNASHGRGGLCKACSAHMLEMYPELRQSQRRPSGKPPKRQTNLPPYEETKEEASHTVAILAALPGQWMGPWVH
uniref:Uncharacterized protein n=1 Tax=Rhizochromulina marina TaxID=1034831 RepID=A0A7S2WTD9_9STRA